MLCMYAPLYLYHPCFGILKAFFHHPFSITRNVVNFQVHFVKIYIEFALLLNRFNSPEIILILARTNSSETISTRIFYTLCDQRCVFNANAND